MFSSKLVTAQDLVYTTNYVEGTMTVADVKGWFQTQMSVFSLGIVVGEGQFGLITRAHLGQHLIGQKNDPALLKAPISEIMISAPLVVEGHKHVETVVNHLMATKGAEDDFFNDIIVHQGSAFVGLISVRDLLLNHIEGLTHRISAMDAQLAALAKKNHELFDNSFRLGKQETRFKEVFEHTHVPIVLFDENGRLTAANPCFLRLTGYSHKIADGKLPFKKLFEGDFRELFQELLMRLKDATNRDETASYNLSLVTRDEDRMMVEALVELTPDARSMMISITESGSITAAERPARVIQDDLEESSGRPGGKITQAIRMKLADSNVMGLARSVASNLIDREVQMDRLMKKLENIIKVAEQIESIDARPPAVPAAPNAKNLEMTGRLAEFSVIDLSQILVQGTKTGQLVLRNTSGHTAGSIYFYCGSIVHAECYDGSFGVDALPVLLAFREGEFEFVFNQGSPAHTISGDATAILMEACRKVDEIA
ncbi:MAG: DUF4388 domain-containing protein [Methylacidiphilales bacterium]|nr:DUF4388 domain-containing protein [Candidatus Methylacidiphilales bacterium]